MVRAGSLLVVVVALGCGAPPLGPQRFAPERPAPQHADWRGRIAARLPEVERELAVAVQKKEWPSAAFGVVAEGELVWSRGFGARDLATKDPVDKDTVYRVGSITKVFTALALLALRDDGLVDLDEPAERLLPELGGAVYPTRDSPRITLRQMMTHTSGLPRVGSLKYDDGHAVTEEELSLAARTAHLGFAPGSDHVYSNLAVGLVGLAVGRAAGMPYRDVVTKRILEPLGMTSSCWEDFDVPTGRLAIGYTRTKEGAWIAAVPRWRIGAGEGMGGLYASTADLARFAAFELAAWPPRDAPDPGPVRRATLRESQLAAGPVRAGTVTQGMGWAVFDDADLGYLIFHNGSTSGYSASLWLVPERHVAIVSFCAAAEAGELDAITKRALVKLLVDPKVLPKQLAPVTMPRRGT